MYNTIFVYCRELVPGFVSLTGDRALGGDSKRTSNSRCICSCIFAYRYLQCTQRQKLSTTRTQFQIRFLFTIFIKEQSMCNTCTLIPKFFLGLSDLSECHLTSTVSLYKQTPIWGPKKRQSGPQSASFELVLTRK